MTKIEVLLRNVECGMRNKNPVIARSEATKQSLSSHKVCGFTLLELLIVISIIAILAAAIVPNFVGFDAEAKIASTQTNLSTLRTRVTLFRAKEGRNPEKLEELLTTSYDDMGAQIPYLEQIPAELISEASGNATVDNRLFKEGLPNDGGWVYITDRRKVVIDVTDALDSKWGSYEDDIPSEW